MARMIAAARRAAARASGARIVFSCGFDSIPFDLGVVFLQDEALRRFGAAAAARARPRAGDEGRLLRRHDGQRAGDDRADRPRSRPGARAGRPVCADAGFPRPGATRARCGRLRRSRRSPGPGRSSWRRSTPRTCTARNALRGHPWGTRLRLRRAHADRRRRPGERAPGRWRAPRGCRTRCSAARPRANCCAASCCPSRARGRAATSATTAATKCCSSATRRRAQRLRAVVRGDRDPGYGSTSKLIAESALCLVQDVEPQPWPRGGIWTPGAAMGLALVRRLQARAG